MSQRPSRVTKKSYSIVVKLINQIMLELLLLLLSNPSNSKAKLHDGEKKV